MLLVCENKWGICQQSPALDSGEEKAELSWFLFFVFFFIFILVITFVTLLKYFLQDHWWDCGCRYIVIFSHSKVVSSAFSNFNDGPLFLYIKWWNLLSYTHSCTPLSVFQRLLNLSKYFGWSMFLVSVIYMIFCFFFKFYFSISSMYYIFYMFWSLPLVFCC